MNHSLRNYSLAQLTELIHPYGSGPGRARKLFSALHRQSVDLTTELEGVNKELLARMDADGFWVSPLRLVHIALSQQDPGTIKFLFHTRKGNPVESVLMPNGDDRTTLCVSSQSGCRQGCRFCATARLGLLQNLSTSEIVTQLVKAQAWLRRHQGPPITNIVFMGMGEPFDNFDSVMAAFDLFNHPLAHHIARDKMTISTCGMVPGIQALGARNVRTNLAVSFNASNDLTRSQLMPVNRRWPLTKIIDALSHYPLRPGRVFYIEYVLIKGVNDAADDARALKTLLTSIPSKVNLIAYNGGSSSRYESTPPPDIRRFASYLEGFSRGVLIRRSRGSDIRAACGQLGGSFRDSCQKRG